MEKRGRTGKKGVGWHPRGGDTRVKAIKIDSDSDSDEQKRSPGFEKKKPAMTPQNWRLKKGRQVFQEKIERWHLQLPPRVSPTLVTPLVRFYLVNECEHVNSLCCCPNLLQLVWRGPMYTVCGWKVDPEINFYNCRQLGVADMLLLSWLLWNNKQTMMFATK